MSAWVWKARPLTKGDSAVEYLEAKQGRKKAFSLEVWPDGPDGFGIMGWAVVKGRSGERLIFQSHGLPDQDSAKEAAEILWDVLCSRYNLHKRRPSE